MWHNYPFFHYSMFFVDKYVKDCEVSHIIYSIIIIIIDWMQMHFLEKLVLSEYTFNLHSAQMGKKKKEKNPSIPLI